MALHLCLPQVIPALSGDATEQTPPDLPSYLFKERIVYLVRVLPSDCDRYTCSHWHYTCAHPSAPQAVPMNGCRSPFRLLRI
jgi:hypothetical protein